MPPRRPLLAAEAPDQLNPEGTAISMAPYGHVEPWLSDGVDPSREGVLGSDMAWPARDAGGKLVTERPGWRGCARAQERIHLVPSVRGLCAQPDRARVILAGQKRSITATIWRERRRRNAIEPVIGHMKSDGHLGRNFLRGTEGDAANVILAVVGHNLRLLRTWLARLLAFLLGLLGAVHRTATARSL